MNTTPSSSEADERLPDLSGAPDTYAIARRHAHEAATAAPESRHPPRATFLRSFVFAWQGIQYTARTQRNMRVHLALAALATVAGLLLGLSSAEWAVLTLAFAGVIVSEMVNTVTESTVDLVTREFHPLARVAKDVAAGAVLVSAMFAIVVGLFVFMPHLWPLFLRLTGH